MIRTEDLTRTTAPSLQRTAVIGGQTRARSRRRGDTGLPAGQGGPPPAHRLLRAIDAADHAGITPEHIALRRLDPRYSSGRVREMRTRTGIAVAVPPELGISDRQA